MEEDIQNYLLTVMFRGTPCMNSPTFLDVKYNNKNGEKR